MKFNLYRQNKGNMMMLAAGAVGILVVVVVLMFTQLLNNKIASSIDRTGYSAAENATYDSIQTNVRTGLDLTSTGVLVGVAAVIIGIVMASFAIK